MSHKDPVARAAYWKRYAAEHREELRTKAHAHDAANRERRRADHREWLRRNDDQQRAYHRVHNEQRRADGYFAAWHVANKARETARVAQWAREHVALRVAGNARRRARKLGSAATHTFAEWLDKVAMFGGCCAYCGEAKPLTRDHKVPLTRGGSDGIENVVPACNPCNARKGVRTAHEFLALGGAS